MVPTVRLPFRSDRSGTLANAQTLNFPACLASANGSIEISATPSVSILKDAIRRNFGGGVLRVIALLSALDEETLERLAHQHLGVQEESRATRCLNLESELRSAKHLRDTIYNLQPPAFAILQALLDAPERALPLAGLREHALEATFDVAKRVTEGLLVGRVALGQLYRRVLCEARRSDMTLDASETAILAVLRHEIGMFQVEHFLAEHHAELQQFWNEEHAFLRAMERMRLGGLVFAVAGKLLLPDDFVAIVRQVLGLEMSSGARRRLVERISGQDAGEILQRAQLRSSGSKEERHHRLLDNFVPPSYMLGALGIGQLRELCRELNLAVSGPKDELVDRAVAHFAADRDIVAPAVEEPATPPEVRALTDAQFEVLFGSLRQQDLSDILAAIGSSRLTGSKQHLLRLVKESRFSEASLLTELGLKQLEQALAKHHLKLTGAKREKVDRLLAYAASVQTPGAEESPQSTKGEPTRS